MGEEGKRKGDKINCLFVAFRFDFSRDEQISVSFFLFSFFTLLLFLLLSPSQTNRVHPTESVSNSLRIEKNFSSSSFLFTLEVV